MAFKHTGFWQPMDTLKDKRYLQELWDSQKCPWKNMGSINKMGLYISG